MKIRVYNDYHNTSATIEVSGDGHILSNAQVHKVVGLCPKDCTCGRTRCDKGYLVPDYLSGGIPILRWSADGR